MVGFRPSVGLISLSDDLALSRSATAEVQLEIGFGQGNSGWNSVNDDDVAGTVTLARGRDSKQLSKGVACHVDDCSSTIVVVLPEQSTNPVEFFRTLNSGELTTRMPADFWSNENYVARV